MDHSGVILAKMASTSFARARVFVFSALRSSIILQERAIRTSTFSKPDEHSDPLFRKLEILRLSDLVMYQYLIIWLCLTRTGNYQVHEFDWLQWKLKAL